MLNKIDDKSFYLLIFFGLFLRIYLALSGDFILEKDEVMQYLEQGHRIAYGYGLIPWEYRVGIRPLIIPYFVAIWLELFSFFGLNQPTEYIPGIKIIFCLFSMSIPLGMYMFCKQNYSKKTGYIALFLGCSWYELIMTAHKPLSEVFSTELMFFGIYFFNLKNIKYFHAATLLSCLAVAVRPHLAPVITTLLIYYYYNKPKEVIINGLAVIAISLLMIGIFEYLTLGAPWLSYYLYFYYNIVMDIASHFGRVPMIYYLWSILFTSVGLFYISFFYALKKDTINKNILPLFSIIIILGLHLSISHKEYRFIYSIIPFWLIIFSSYISALTSNNNEYQRTLIIFTIISGLGLNRFLPKQQLVLPLINHNGNSYFKKSDSLNAYLFLSTINDKGGIIDYTNSWLQSGGYYYLHRNVPLDHTLKDPENSHVVQESIQSDITNVSVKYIITYENMTSNQAILIKTFGKVNIYQFLRYNKAINIENYNYNRYIVNIPL